MAPVPDGNQEGPNRNEDISDFGTPQIVIDVESDETSSDEEPADLGYQLLPQDPDTAGDTGDNGGTEVTDHEEATEMANTFEENTFRDSLESQGIHNAALSAIKDLPSVQNIAAAERRAVWNQPRLTTPDMDTEHVQKIKAAMVNFKVPTPDWARTIPEEQWKQQLLERLETNPSGDKHENKSKAKATSGKDSLKLCNHELNDDETKNVEQCMGSSQSDLSPQVCEQSQKDSDGTDNT